MANIYIRVPHYVAAFHRNRDQFKPIPVGGVIRIDRSSPLWPSFSTGLYHNVKGEVFKYGCFNEKQWRTMLTKLNHQQKAVNPNTLTDDEVLQIAQVKPSSNKCIGEYLCVKLPEEVYIHPRMHRTTPTWQPTVATTKTMIALFTSIFWRAFMSHMRRHKECSMALGVENSVMDAIDEFINRYDIHISVDDRERKALKRSYYRKSVTTKVPDEIYCYMVPKASKTPLQP